jgi:hypothetical protein
MRFIPAIFSACIFVFSPAMGKADTAHMDPAKLEAFADANIKATHAYEALAAKKLGKELREKYWNVGGVPDKELNHLVELQKEMLAQPAASILAWAAGQPSDFDEKKYIRPILDSKLSLAEPKLPVNVWVVWFKEKAPEASAAQVKSLANLQQVLAEIDRDGDLLQDLFRVYAALHLPVYFGQLGIKASSDEEFMVFAKDVTGRMIGGPYDESPEIVRMAFRKMYNWGRRYDGERDKTVIARELLAEPGLQDAVARAGKVGPTKIAVIGHSFTMEVHWATPGSFVPVVAEMMKTADPDMEFKYFQGGGLDAVWSYKALYPEVLKWHPDMVLFVVMSEGADQRSALKSMVDGFSAVGTKCVMFDSLWPADFDLKPKKTDPVLATTKLNIIEVQKLLMASPDKDKFVCLDGVHMTEPWHLLMAREWFKYLAGARKEELGVSAAQGEFQPKTRLLSFAGSQVVAHDGTFGRVAADHLEARTRKSCGVPCA